MYELDDNIFKLCVNAWFFGGGRGGSDTPPRPGVGVLLNGEGREKEILTLINKVSGDLRTVTFTY